MLRIASFRFAAAFLVLLFARVAGAQPSRVAFPPGPIDVEAGKITYDAALDRYILSEGAVLRRGSVVLRARTASYSPTTGEVDAAGEVLLLEPGRALAAAGMHAILDGPFEAHEVVAFGKDTPLDLSRATSLTTAERMGRNRVTLGGAAVHGDGGEEFSIEHARITLCDCGGGAPSWEIRAHGADVVPGRRAILTWPVFYVTPRFLFVDKPVPVFVLPWLYLPLGERQAGLLLPEVNYGAHTGLMLSEPIFVPFGPSYDATVTLDYAFGVTGARSVEGAGGSVELRWAPVAGASGRFRIFELHDVARDVSGAPPHGDRIALALGHDQRFGDGSVLHVEAGLVNDPLYVQDFTGDVLLRGVEYRRSSAAFTAPHEDLLLEAHTDYLLRFTDLGQQTFPENRLSYGLFGSAVPNFHRLPSASATLLPVHLAGPLRLSATAGVARFAPIHGVTGDEGANGIGPGDRGWPGLGVPPPYSNPGQLDGRWEPGERLAATRASLGAEVRAPMAVGSVLTVEPWLSGTTTGYTFEAAHDPLANAWGVAGLAISTELARSVGAGRHVMEPRVEWRAGTGELGPALPAYAYDELDFAPAPSAAPNAVGPGGLPLRPLSAAPPGGFNQLRLSVRNRVTAPAGPLSRDLLGLDLGQDFDLTGSRLAETWARGNVGLGPLLVNLLARFYAFGAGPPAGTPTPTYSSWLDRFTELRADATLSDARGDNVHASLLALGSGASSELKAGLEPLFDARPIAPELTTGQPLLPMAYGRAGAKARILKGLDAGYDVDFTARTISIARCPGGTGPSRPYVVQHVGTFIWDSPCRCWKAGAILAVNPCDLSHPTFQVVFDLSQLGLGRFP